jgi:hypothetical protein
MAKKKKQEDEQELPNILPPEPAQTGPVVREPVTTTTPSGNTRTDF